MELLSEYSGKHGNKYENETEYSSPSREVPNNNNIINYRGY